MLYELSCIYNPSVILHGILWPCCPPQSLCARAWDRRAHAFWAGWVVVFRPGHCRRSWEWWRG